MQKDTYDSIRFLLKGKDLCLNRPGSARSLRGGVALDGCKTVVTWTLTPVSGGTHVRIEQSGFRFEDEGNYQRASYGWQRFIDSLERVAASLD